MVGFAHILAAGCSLGALYNVGDAFLRPNTISDISGDELSQEASSEHENPIDSSEEESSLSPEETLDLIDSLEMNAYLKGMLTATHFGSSSNRIQSLVYAIGLGAIAYLLLQNQSQSDQIRSLTSTIHHCEAKIHPHTLQRLRLDSLKPHPDSFFFGEAAYRIINFMNHMPIDKNCLNNGQTPKENCKYMAVKISDRDVCMEYCAQATVSADKNTLFYTANPVYANNTFIDQVELSITEQFQNSDDQLKITSVCTGFFKTNQTVSFESEEVITANASEHQGPNTPRVGSYSAKEKVGSRVNNAEKFYQSENLDIKPFDMDQALPWLQKYLKSPSANALQKLLNE